MKSALDATEEERLRAYEAKWAEGGQHQLPVFVHGFAAQQAVQRNGIGVRPPENPRDGQRSEDGRIAVPQRPPYRHQNDSFSIPTITRPTTATTSLWSISGASRSRRSRRPGCAPPMPDTPLDAIVFATGFDAMTGAMKEIDIHTDAGLSIRAKWEDGPRTYLGLMIAGFPNLFMITGPQSPGVKSQMILACEQHVDWIADCVRYLRDRGLTRIEADQEAEDAWVQHNNEVADRTLYPWPTHGTSGPIFRKSPASSCLMSAASPPTRRNVMRLRQRIPGLSFRSELRKTGCGQLIVPTVLYVPHAHLCPGSPCDFHQPMARAVDRSDLSRSPDAAVGSAHATTPLSVPRSRSTPCSR